MRLLLLAEPQLTVAPCCMPQSRVFASHSEVQRQQRRLPHDEMLARLIGYHVAAPAQPVLVTSSPPAHPAGLQATSATRCASSCCWRCRAPPERWSHPSRCGVKESHALALGRFAAADADTDAATGAAVGIGLRKLCSGCSAWSSIVMFLAWRLGPVSNRPCPCLMPFLWSRQRSRGASSLQWALPSALRWRSTAGRCCRQGSAAVLHGCTARGACTLYLLATRSARQSIRSSRHGAPATRLCASHTIICQASTHV